jgi:WXXGXW repeat (2 copies)
MNTRIRIALAGIACLAACAVGFAQNAGTDSQIPGAAPSQGYVWMSGHWNSEGGQWKWVAAHWDLPPSRSATWVGGHWVSSSGSWVWVNGAWNVSDAQQAQAGPPQPPGPGVQGYAQQGVPSPTTPAPYVDGQYQAQYGPGAVTRAIDQDAGTTDYGPADSVAYSGYGYPGYVYPAYGWVGDPWFWGFPGVALGFGFGPGFHGGGYYRGHGFAGHGAGFASRGGFGARGLGGHFGR